MLNDSITEEIRDIRRKLAAQFDNDVSRILADVREREASDGHAYITLPKRPARFKSEMSETAAVLALESQPNSMPTRGCAE